MCLTVLLWGAVLGAQPEPNFCPVETGKEAKEISVFKTHPVPSSKTYTVPRKQVLLEIATATW